MISCFPLKGSFKGDIDIDIDVDVDVDIDVDVDVDNLDDQLI